MAKRKKPEVDESTYEVTVWNDEGDIVKKLWEATIEEADEVREEYADDPFKTVIIEEK